MNTSDVIKWFQNIKNKKLHTFTVFDIQEFCPSIREKLLKDAVLFAQTYANISRKDIEVIFHCRRSLLFHNNEPWIKKDSSGDFDVTMGSFNGAEVCELAGLFMLNELSKKFDKDNIGLYRDYGLSVFKNYNSHQNDKVRKGMIDLFKQHHLNLEIKCNLKIVDYLDITFDLTTGLFKPYNKTNNIPRYVNAKSNHPPSILKEIPKSVSKRTLLNSCNEQVFRVAAPFYNDILDKCGYSEELTFEKEQYTHERRNRGRNIWYNPSFCKNVKTNIAKQFLHLLDKNFGRNHKYHKIFNRNHVKNSYSGMDNVKNIISSHNKKIINSGNEANGKTCNCRNKSNCPLDNKYLTNKIVYKAEIETNNDTNKLSTKVYFGISETEFKSR